MVEEETERVGKEENEMERMKSLYRRLEGNES